jgi:RNA polymerase-binding transcription factor DksA
MISDDQAILHDTVRGQRVDMDNPEVSMPPIDIQQTLADLKEERATLLHQLAELGADSSGELTGDMDYGDAFADAGAATAERTETMGIIENLKIHLDGVDGAISRIDEGTYGVCTVCGNDISEDRMLYRPASSQCISCKSNHS